MQKPGVGRQHLRWGLKSPSWAVQAKGRETRKPPDHFEMSSKGWIRGSEGLWKDFRRVCETMRFVSKMISLTAL